VGYYDGGKLTYPRKVKSGFPETEILRKFKGIVRPKCPFVNLPIGSSRRCGFGVTRKK
jgi:hypothetical protein